MKKIIGIVLIGLGIFLFMQGLNRKDSIAGAAATVGTEVANRVDGGVRTPKHMVYMVGGVIVAVIGLASLFRGPRSV